MSSNIVRRGDLGLGKTISGGNRGSFGGHQRAAAAPPEEAELPVATPFGEVNGIPVYTSLEVQRELEALHGPDWYLLEDTGWVNGYDGNPGAWYRQSDIDAADPTKRPAWAQDQQHRRTRGHDFYPSRPRLERVPTTYETDDTVVGAGGKICFEHYFSPTDDFYVVELDQSTGEAFGIWKNRHGETELTYVSLPELETRHATAPNGLPHYFERDLDFETQRAAKAMPEKYAACAVHRLNREQLTELETTYDAWRAHAKTAYADDFDVTTIEAFAERKRELERAVDQVAEKHGIAIVAKDAAFNIWQVSTLDRGDWVDTELAGDTA